MFRKPRRRAAAILVAAALLLGASPVLAGSPRELPGESFFTVIWKTLARWFFWVEEGSYPDPAGSPAQAKEGSYPDPWG